MANNIKYTVRLGDGRTQQWTPEMYEQAKDKLFGKYPDAEVVRTSVYDPAEGYDQNDSFQVQLSDGRGQVWDADQIAKGYDNLMKKYPDAQVSRVVDESEAYWKPKAEEARRVLDLFNKDNGQFLNRYEDSEKAVYAHESGIPAQVREFLESNKAKYEELAALRNQYKGDYYMNPYTQKQYRKRAEEADYLRDEYKRLAKEATTAEERNDYNRAAKMMEDARKVYQAPLDYVDDSDKSNGFLRYLKGMGKGAGDTFTDEDFWTLGITEIARNLDLRKIAEKIQGLETEDEIDKALSPSEKAQIMSLWNLQEAQRERAGSIANSYEAGQMAAQSLPFMADFLISGGLANLAGKGLIKGAAKTTASKTSRALASWLGKELMSNKAYMRALGKVAEAKGVDKAFLKGLATSAEKQTAGAIANNVLLKPLIQGLWHTPTQLSSYQTISQMMLETNENGELISRGQAWGQGLLDSFIENWSESLGAGFEGIAIPKFGGKTQFGRFARWMLDSRAHEVLVRGGFNGLIGEMGEEWAGNAVRLGLGLMSKEDFKDFASLEQQLTMAAGFGPMTLLGLGSSVPAAIKGAADYKKLSIKARDVLMRHGHTEDEVNELLKTRFDTSEDIAKKLAPYLIEIAGDVQKEGGPTKQAREDYKVILDLAKNLGIQTTLDEIETIENNERKTAMNDFIEQSVGGRYWQEAPDGQRSVTVVTDKDGKTYYVTGTDGNGKLTAISTEDGKPHFINENEVGEGQMQTSSYDDFLQGEVDAIKQDEEAQRMQAETNEQVAAVRQEAQQRGSVPMQAEDGSMVEVPILAQTNAGAVVAVDEQGNPTQIVPWKDVAIKYGTPIDVKTDAQLEAEAQKQYEEANERLDTYKNIRKGDTVTYTDGEGNTHSLQFGVAVLDDGMIMIKGLDEDGREVSITEDMATNLDQLVKEATFEVPFSTDSQVGFRDEEGVQHHATVIREDDGSGKTVVRDQNGVVSVVPSESLYAEEAPVEGEKPAVEKYTDSEGNVDEDAFLAAEPEEWAKWNDARNNDGGADSQALLTANLKKLDSEIKKQTSAVDKEASANNKRKLQAALRELTEQREKLAAALERYNKPNTLEAEAQEAKAQESQSASAPTEAAKPAEEQKPVDPVEALTGGQFHMGDPAVITMKERNHALGTIVGVSRAHEGWVSVQIEDGRVFSVPAGRLIPATEEALAMIAAEQQAIAEAQAQAEAEATQQAIADAEAQVDTNPTEAQKEAGNYRKGHVTIDGYDITIENPKGSTRSGVDKNGKKWSQTMNNTYGYIRMTTGVDGDQIDVFLSDNPTEGKVFVIDQVDPETGAFDEHKVMYGFNSMEEAQAAYLANYEPGWKGLGTITEVSKEEFKKWVDSSSRKTKPFSEYKSVKADAAQSAGVQQTEEPTEATPNPEAGKIRQSIERWKKYLGDIFVELNSAEDVNAIENEGIRNRVLAEMGKPRSTVYGFFDVSTGKAYLLMPNIRQSEMVDRTVIHEVLAHKGLRYLLDGKPQGGPRFNALMDKVWNELMTEEDKYEELYYINDSLPAPSEADKATKKRAIENATTAQKRAAADEFVAHTAERSEGSLATEATKTAWEKFVNWVRELLNDMIGADVLETEDKSTSPFHELLRQAMLKFHENAEADLNNKAVAANGEEVRFSVRYVPSEQDAKRIAEDIAKEVDIPKKKATAWVKSETSLAPIILDEENQPYLDYIGDDRYAAIKEDTDYPQGTVDFNNICRKRLAFTDMYQRIQKAFPYTIITGKDLATIRQIMKDHGIMVACGLCYVEDRRQLLGEVANEFIAELQHNFEGYASKNENKSKVADKLRKLVGEDKKEDLSVYDLITLEGSRKLYEEHRGIYDAFQAYNNARGQQTQNLFQGYAEYKREILKWSARKVKSVNDHGGLRIFSYSDFEAHHLIDLVQIIQDCARKGIMIQGYTKVPAFARAIANTNVKINRSLIPLGDTGMVEGKLAYDPVEGIDISDPDFLESNDNVGNILIGINDEQIKLAMADPFVHYIIPFHSNQSAELRKAKSVGEWKNYKNEQEDKGGNPVNIYTDVLAAAEAEGKPIKTEKQFVEKFLSVCKERGLTPRFWRFLDTNKKGEYVYTPGYYKLLVDFKLFDENGKILPQKPVVAEFDDEFNAQILNDYVRGEKEAAGKLDDAVYEEIVAALGLPERNAEAVQDKALAFVNGITTKEAMVIRTNKSGKKGMSPEAKARKEQFEKDKEAIDNIRLSKVYHGSGADFERFDHSHMGEGEGAQMVGWGTYVTTNPNTGREYAERFGKDGERHLYTVEIPDDNGQNYLHWNEPITNEQSDKIMDAVRKLADKDSWGDEFEYELKSTLGHGTLGRYVDAGLDYFLGNEMNYATGEDPGAERNSRLLSDLGIVGMQYPFDRAGYDETHYVIYNEDDLEIIDNLRFSKGEENINAGIAALEQIANGADVVRNAMYRKDLSQFGADVNISFYWGKEGDSSKNFKKGYGISHIGAKHGAEAILKADTYR